MFVSGAILALITFLQPGLVVIIYDEDLTLYEPAGFWWWLFVPSYFLMMCGLGTTLRTAEINSESRQE